MTKVIDIYPGETVYCLDNENIPVKGTVTSIQSVQGVISITIQPEFSTDDRDPLTKDDSITLWSHDVYKDMDSLVDAQIERLRLKINYWESLRTAELK